VIVRDRILIGSRWAEPSTGDRIEVVSPSTEEVVASVPLARPADVDRAVVAARAVADAGEWAALTVADRAAQLQRMVDLLIPRAEEAARLSVLEMGAPYSYLKGNIDFVLGRLQAEADMVARVPLRDVRDGPAGPVIVTRTPVGVVGAIIPWNSPVPSVLLRTYSALLTGSALVIKPATESPLSAFLIAEAAVESGLPEGLLGILAGGADVGEHVVRHPGIDKVSFTGSTATGRRVASLAGETLKVATMELGGKSAAIILEDADLDAHLPAIVNGSISSNGQVCHSTTRILVPRSRADEVTSRIVEAVAGLRVGDPDDPATFVGPLVSRRQRDRVEGYIASGVEQGARLALGGGRPVGHDRGWYVEPTVFTDVRNDMTIAREEIFGPVLCVIPFDDLDDAVRIANDSEYGLGGAVFTEDLDAALDVAARIQTGSFVINEGAGGGGGGPFGGVKNSGVGRERGQEGFDAYYTLKSVSLPHGVRKEDVTR
jgi:aldehyde dehydrogenase (NAD+)